MGEHLGVGRGIGLLAGGDAVGFFLAGEAMSGGDEPSERMEPEDCCGPSPGDGPEEIVGTHVGELVVEQGVELDGRQMCSEMRWEQNAGTEQTADERRHDVGRNVDGDGTMDEETRLSGGGLRGEE